jgi:hypothetical protein
MVLGGCFLELHARDISDDGYPYEQKLLRTYDSTKNAYVDYVFVNDGTVNMNTVALDGNIWTMTGTVKDSAGKNFTVRRLLGPSNSGCRQDQRLQD